MASKKELISNERLNLIRALGNKNLSIEEKNEAKEEYTVELNLIKSGFYDEDIYLNEDFQVDL